ncbi:MAG: DUF1146 domain-containing protein [Bacilli bacterium]|nr:DUF1146 domain-containing protein [Bacilli bacterium]
MIKIYLYTIVLFLVIWVMDSVDFNRFFKKNKNLQARILYLMICIVITYMVVNFMWDFYSISKI